MIDVMPRSHARLVLAFLIFSLIMAGMVVTGVTVSEANASVTGKYFFTGVTEDEANKQAGEPSSTFSKTAPTDTTNIVQNMSPNCNENVVANALCALWTGPYIGTFDGPVEFCWYFASQNPAAIELGVDLQISVFADPDYATGGAQPERLIGQDFVTLSPGVQPTANVVAIDVKGAVKKEMLIQIRTARDSVNTGTPTANTPPPIPPNRRGDGLTVHYGSTGAPSSFGNPGTTCPATGGSATPTASSTSTSTQSPTASPTSTATPTPTPTQTGTATTPGVTLKVSDSTPVFGSVVKAKGSLKKCPGHAGTKLQLQKKNKQGKFAKVQAKKLNSKCKATFKFKAKFKKATFRAFWSKQDQDHRAGKSKPKTIRTHPPR